MCNCGHKKYEHRDNGRCRQTKRAINGYDWCGCRSFSRAASTAGREEVSGE